MRQLGEITVQSDLNESDSYSGDQFEYITEFEDERPDLSSPSSQSNRASSVESHKLNKDKWAQSIAELTNQNFEWIELIVEFF